MKKEKVSKKQFKITKKHLRKAFNGSISILLCLLLTPFLTIALCLVEYSRYQQVINMAEEFYELTGVSVLSNYDTYIHDRFGLLATSQEDELDAELDTFFTDNLAALGGQATAADPAVKGLTSLADPEVLRQQVVDFSEMTVTTAILAEDFNMEELLEKLNGIKAFSDITNTVSQLATVTDKLTVALDKFKALQDALLTLNTQLTNAKTQAELLADQMAELIKKLGDEGIMLPQNASLEEIEATVSEFTDSYLQDFKDLYATAHDLVESINSIKGQLTTIKSAAEAVVTAVEDAAETMDSLGTSNSADSQGKISEAAESVLDEILKEMVDIVESTIEDIQNSLIETANEMLNEIVQTTLEETGLAGLITRYSEIVNGEYFGEEMSETAKQDIIDFLQIVHEVYTDASDSSDIFTAIKNFLLEKFYPNMGFDVNELYAEVGNIITKATDALKKKAGDSLWTMLSKLLNIVKSMFDLDVFYDPELNAFVDITSDQSGGYQSFLTAVGNLFQDIEDFGEALGDWDVYEALDAMKNMFTHIKEMLEAIFEIVDNMLTSLLELGEAALSGDVRALYEKVLISGYMTHNLPNRTNASYTTYEGEGNVTMLNLTGQALTGFKYDNIARPALYAGQDATLEATGNKTKLQQLASFIRNLQAGHGQDKMFMGAELEYIRAGTNSEIVNQTICFMDLYFLRILLDLPSIFTSAEVTAIAGAANIAAWVVYILYIIAEPFLDTIILVNGGEVHLVRGYCWMTPSGIDEFINAFTQVTIANEKLRDQISGTLKDSMESFADSYGQASQSTSVSAMPMTYDSYILLILFIYVDSDMQIQRLQDLIKLETAQYYRNNGGSFSMYKTYTSIEISGDLTINTLIDFGLLTGDTSIIPSARLKQILGY